MQNRQQLFTLFHISLFHLITVSPACPAPLVLFRAPAVTVQWSYKEFLVLACEYTTETERIVRAPALTVDRVQKTIFKDMLIQF